MPVLLVFTVSFWIDFYTDENKNNNNTNNNNNGIKVRLWAWQSLLLWQFSWRHWYTWSSVQVCSEPSCETSRFKRVHQSCLRYSGHSGKEGTSRSCSKWWKTPRRLHFYSMATLSMGCHSLHHRSCFLLDRGKSYSRRGSWTSCRHEMLKIQNTLSSTHESTTIKVRVHIRGAARCVACRAIAVPRTRWHSLAGENCYHWNDQ